MRYFIPFVTVTYFNDKNRIQFAVINQSPVREPHRDEWISTTMTENDIDECIRHNGSYATTNVFFRIQSGHSGLTKEQREELSPPYDFRRNTLMHKTTAYKWNQMKNPGGRRQVIPFDRDVHFVPTEFLYHDPEMLRQYGERILIFNMHDPATRDAFSTARETANGYVLVSEPVSVDVIEGVFDLEAGIWEFPWGPKCRPAFVEKYGVNDAEKLCKYFRKVYHQESCTFDNLEPNLRNAVITIGQHYEQNLRYAPAGTPGFVKADTPANVQRSKEVQKEIIVEIVDDVADQIEQKKKKKTIQPKAMPKPDPPDLPDSAKLMAKTKPPPACALTPPGKAPPKGFEKRTDTTVKVKEEQTSSPTDTTVKKAKSSSHTETTVKKESSNKISPPPQQSTVPSTPATSSATPIPPAGPPPERIPQPPPYPPRKPQRSAGQPFPTPPPAPQRDQRFPTPPPAPTRDYPQSSDNTEERVPLPRRRRETQQDDETMRPNFSYDFDQTTNLEAYVDILTSLSDQAPDAYTARERRLEVWNHIMELVEQGVSTGSKMLDRMLLHSRDAVLTTENVYYVPYVPTPEEHFYRQDPGEAGMLFRPNLMLNIEDHEFTLDVLDALAELGRNVLAGRAVLSDHPLNMSVEYFNTTTYYLTMVVLNLGNIKRIPYFANRKRYPSWIRENWSEMKKRLVLPYLVVNKPGHIITLCERYDFCEHNDLCIEYNVIGIQVYSTKELRSPSIAIFLKLPYGIVELMNHWDVSHRDDFWVIHAVLARCVFGPKTHDVHGGTRERTEHRYNGEPVENFAFSSEARFSTHGCKNIETPEDQLDPIETYEEITNASYFEVGGLPESFVERLGMTDVRVLTIHINSDAFRNSILRVRDTLRAIFAKALMSYTDFITGDFHLFANRQFKTDRGGAYIGGIVVEVLEDVVSAMNEHLEPQKKITFNISSSTPPQDVFDTITTQGSQSGNLDCMLCISVFYNRQGYDTARPAMITPHLHLAPDYLHNVSERPRQLSCYDVCLKPSDNDWHIPLIVRTSAYATHNKRTRGQFSQDLRNQRYRDWQNRSYQYQQSRYHGSHHRQDHGPYSRASSSTGKHLDGWYGGWR